MALVTENTAMFAPMPRASVNKEISANPGDLAQLAQRVAKLVKECVHRKTFPALFGVRALG